MAVLMEHSNATPLAPSEMSEKPIPQDLDALVVECLSKDRVTGPLTRSGWRAGWTTCRVAGWWTQQQARAWWALHLPELLDRA